MAKKYPYTVTLALPDGRRKYYRGATKKEAEEKRDKDKALLGGGVNLADKSTFQEVAELWFYLLKEDQLHTKSKETIKGTLARHVYPMLGGKKIRDIKPADIFALMKSVSSKSNSLQKKVLQYVKSIFAFAMDNDLILKSPVPSSLKAAGAETEEVEALTDEQCAALLEAVRGTRAYLFVELLLYTGLRRGEALGLMWKDINFKTAELKVCRSIVYTEEHPEGEINSDLKTSNARRDIPIVPWLLEDLKEAKAKSNALYVFSMQDGSFLSKTSLRRMWDVIGRRTVGSETKRSLVDRVLDFKVHPHQLRHTCITRWIESGMDLKEVQYLAGHATADITMNIYAHYRKAQLLSGTAAKMAATKIG